tara:strand:+ start:1015 stop:1341 length:327 start_codon:yes stop_codon:yes gene_type:complete
MTETKEKDYKLSDLILDACDTYDSDDYDDMKEGYDDSDIVHEIADNAVPIYYWDIAQYAAWNTWLMTEIPEINPDGNAHDQIQANIYSAICEGLYEHIAEKEEEDETV